MALYHSVKGPVDYTIVGTPTIVDGVVSGFSSSDYVQCSPLPSSITSFEHQLKFTTGNSAPEVGSYWGLSGFGTSRAGFYITPDNVLGCHWINFDTDRRRQYLSNLILNNNTTYWVKWTFLNGVATIYYSTDGVNWTNETMALQETASAGTYTDFCFGNTSSGTFNGSIDLNHTYIKVNGQPWFGLCPVEVQKHQLMGPVGYTVRSSIDPNITIVDGIASGFSQRIGGICVDDTFDWTADWEVVVKYKTTGEASSSPVIQGDGRSNAFFVVPGRTSTSTDPFIYSIRFGRGTESDTYLILIGEGIRIVADTWYWAKIRKVGTNYYCSYRTENEPYSTETSIVFANVPSSNLIWNFAYSSYWTTNYFKGSIDFNETYIKVNGKLWFWQPAPTKYIVKDGKLVWADPLIYIDDNGTKTYATQNIAPVPANYTYGTTTTSAIGYVDMRTQQFTAAPTGATIGRDE